MSVINTNNAGPIAPDTTIVPTSDRQCLIDILMELRIIRIYLAQGFNITDEAGALRNSLTLLDLNNLG